MKIITSQNEISNILGELDKSSIQRIDQSYYRDINFIHCVVQFQMLNQFAFDRLAHLSIDESLINHSSKILIYIKSSINLLKIDVEKITDTISKITNNLDFHINWQVDFKYDYDKFDLSLLFVE